MQFNQEIREAFKGEMTRKIAKRGSKHPSYKPICLIDSEENIFKIEIFKVFDCENDFEVKVKYYFTFVFKKTNQTFYTSKTFLLDEINLDNIRAIVDLGNDKFKVLEYSNFDCEFDEPVAFSLSC